jgi:hypothetical protein
VYVEEIPSVTRKSKRSNYLLGSVCHYVGFPVVKNEKFFFAGGCIAL